MEDDPNDDGRERGGDGAGGSVGETAAALKKHRSRQYRMKPELAAQGAEKARTLPSLGALEEEMLAHIEAAVSERLAAAMDAPETQKLIEVRLMEARAKLEASVTAQLESERVTLMETRRRAAEEAARRQAELDHILRENQRKVEEAHRRAEEQRQQQQQQRDGGRSEDMGALRVR